MAMATGQARGRGAQARRALGAYGEALAARYLIERGMALLDHNWRCPQGEIDLVLRDGDTLVFCEVKTRRTPAYGAPVEAVGEAKAQRLRRLGALWVQAHDVRVEHLRLDLVGVLAPRSGAPAIDHVPGVG